MGKNNLKKSGTKRRTFLKTVGITVGAAGFESTAAISKETITDGEAQQETPGSNAEPGGWSTRRGNPSRTGQIDDLGPDPYPVTELKMDFDGTMYGLEPVFTEQALYISVTTDNTPPGMEGYLGKFDIQSGDELWRQTNLVAPKTPTVGSDHVYAATKVTEDSDPGETGLYALDRQSGDIAWSRTEAPKWGIPAVVNDMIYTENNNGALAVHPSSGATIWEANSVGSIAKGFDGQVSLANETVYLADGTALDAGDGSVLWEVSGDDPVLGNQAVRADFVFFLRKRNQNGSTEVALEARSAQTGDLQWTYRSEDNQWNGDHAVSDNCVIITEATNVGSDIVGLDIPTGVEKWRTPVQGDFVSSVTGDRNSVYAGGRYVPETSAEEQQAFVVAIDRATGEKRWTYLLDSSGLETSSENPPAAGTPVVAEGKLCIATYPAGSTLDYEYTSYSNFFVLGTSESPPDDDHMGSTGDTSDGDGDSRLKARIGASSNQDLSDLSPGETIRLDGSSSTGTDLTYEWDIDGDGQYDESGSSVCVTVPNCGSLTVALRVTNADGDTDTATVSLSPN